jgi:hypothetical protein
VVVGRRAPRWSAASRKFHGRATTYRNPGTATWSLRLFSFVSSNPAIDARERYPTPRWGDAERVDFFQHRFSGGERAWTQGFRTLLRDGRRYDAAPRAGKYWAEIHQRAIELLGADPKPGIDYALTEVVHCKSSGNKGVAEARMECASRYLGPVLEAAAARVIVIVGKQAWEAFADRYGKPECFGVARRVSIAGRERMLVSIGAPNSSQPRKLTNCLNSRDLAHARRLLKRDLHLSSPG